MALAPLLDVHRAAPATVVLGIARGGMPAAAAVAETLHLPLDLLLLKRLLLQDGVPLCAAWCAGTLVTPNAPALHDDSVHPGVAESLERFAERNALCRGDRAPLSLEGQTVILVDNGVHTGGTMHAAIAALRSFAPRRIIAAVPLASTDARARLHDEADEVVCPEWRDRFTHVGMWYQHYDVPADSRLPAFLAVDVTPTAI